MPLWAYSLARRLVHNLRRFSTPPQVEAKRIASPTSFGGAERDAKWLQHRVAALGFDVTVPERATQPTCPIDFLRLLWFDQNSVRVRPMEGDAGPRRRSRSRVNSNGATRRRSQYLNRADHNLQEWLWVCSCLGADCRFGPSRGIQKGGSSKAAGCLQVNGLSSCQWVMGGSHALVDSSSHWRGGSFYGIGPNSGLPRSFHSSVCPNQQ